jgi:hypothetical protein
MQKQLELNRNLHFEELRKLANSEGPCITVSLALQTAPNTSRVDFQKLNSANRSVEQKLEEEWPDLSKEERRELIEPLGAVAENSDEWGGSGGTLVILRSRDVFRAFEVHDPNVPETVQVGEFFHVFPYIHGLQLAGQVFYLLALSQNNVRLLRCTRDSSEVIDLGPNTYTSLEEWLNTRMPNASPEHGTVRQSDTGSTGGSFTSTTDMDNKDRHIANFFNHVNDAVFEALRGKTEPLVLCGVDYERTIYQQVNTYPHLWQEGVHGSPESLKGGEMHARALEAVQDYFAEPAKKALEQWDRLAGGTRATAKFPDIVKAAFEGRVASLLAKEGTSTMGVFDRSTMEMKVAGRQEDLVNAAALQTLAFGGEVFILRPEDVPGGSHLAAVLRY